MSDNTRELCPGFGARFRDLRQSLGINQKQMGTLLGVVSSYISALERGKETPSDRFIKQVAAQFHVREEWLRSGDGSRDVGIGDLMAPVLESIKVNGPWALSEAWALLSAIYPGYNIEQLEAASESDKAIAALVLQELAKARAAHGPMHGRHEGYAVILEELDELWNECKKRKPEDMSLRKEAIQVAAMAMRFVLDVCPIQDSVGADEQD